MLALSVSILPESEALSRGGFELCEDNDLKHVPDDKRVLFLTLAIYGLGFLQFFIPEILLHQRTDVLFRDKMLKQFL